jgi:ABC-type sugar transport system permease subunit
MTTLEGQDRSMARSHRTVPRTSGLWREVVRHKHVYLWISPFLIFFAVVQLYPTISGFAISLFDWDGSGPMTWVGLGNFTALMHDPLFWKTTVNTLVLLVLIVPLRTLLALVLAAMINAAVVKRKQFYSAFLLLPNLTAIVVVAIIFQILLTTKGGLVNAGLTHLGLPAVPWLDSTEWSKVSLAVLNIWKSTGYFTLIMLAGLQQIPKVVYEAADIDGAGPVRTFFAITVPQMRNVILFVVIVSIIWLVQNIADALVLTQGGPQYSSTPLMYYMFLSAFDHFDLGYAAAIAVILFVLMSLLSGGVFAVNRRNGR